MPTILSVNNTVNCDTILNMPTTWHCPLKFRPSQQMCIVHLNSIQCFHGTKIASHCYIWIQEMVYIFLSPLSMSKHISVGVYWHFLLLLCILGSIGLWSTCLVIEEWVTLDWLRLWGWKMGLLRLGFNDNL